MTDIFSWRTGSECSVCLFEEFTEGYKSLTGDERQEELSIATGKLAYPYISAMAEKIEEKFPNLEIHVFSDPKRLFRRTHYCVRTDHGAGSDSAA